MIVCHGGVVDGSFTYFFGLGAQHLPPVRFHTHNTSITQWQCNTDDERPHRWRLMRYNDEAHLRGIGADQPISWREVQTQAEHPAVPTPSETNGHA